MSDDQPLYVTHAQRDRLAFIDLRLRYLGEIGRQDLVNRFGIRSAAASRDLAQYRDTVPHNLDYDTRSRGYVRGAWFRPVYDFSAERVLTWLTEAFGDTEPLNNKSIVATAGSSLPHKIDLEILSVLTRAIHQGAVVEVAYRALSSGLTTREIVPFALADCGLRWHVRAFDRRSGEFRDFVLGRLADARIVPSPVAEVERSDHDIQWNRITELELVPHPANVQHPDTIEAEYDMEGGVLKVRARAAMAGYLLRRWSVDCTADHSLKGAEFHLWLRNRQALYGVTNLVLAPGYESREKT